nr:hypothetical protein [Tanacetum cinerariifolium]
MRTRSQSRNNFPQQEASPFIVEPLRIELPFLEDQFQEDPPVDPPEVSMANNRTMAELLQAPTEGYEDVIVILEIAANNFELKHGLINFVQNKQFFRHDKEDPHAHIRYFNKITSTMRVPNVPSSSIKLMLFPFSLEGAAQIWLKKEAPRSILTWDDLVTKFINQFFPPLKTTNLRFIEPAAGGNFLDKMPRECLKIIKSKSKVRQSRAKAVVAKVSTSSSTLAISSKVFELKDLVRALLLDKKNQSLAHAQSSTPALVKAIKPNCVTCGGTHSYQNCPATSGNIYRDNIQEYVSQAAAANYDQGNIGFQPQMVANQIRPPSFPPHQNHQNNFNRGNNFNQNRGAYQAQAYQAPIPQTLSVTQTDFESYFKANDTVLRNMQSQCQDLKGITTRSGAAYQGPPIPTQSKVVKQGTEVTKDQVQTPSSQSTAPVQPSVAQPETQTLVSEPIVAPVSVPIPYPSRRDNERRYSPKINPFYCDPEGDILLLEAILNSEPLPPLPNHKQYIPSYKKELKLSEMARTPMNEHCSAVILNKLPRKLGDPSKFLIPCEFPGIDECLALADLDFEPDPRVPLILGRCFLKIDRALIDVHNGELTLRIGNEAITYKLDQTMRYSANYNQMTANKIDVICEMYSQEVIGFSGVTVSGNPTPYDDPIVSTTSPTLTSFGDSGFLLFEEAYAFLGLKDDPNSPKINPFYYDPKGDILFLEAILNSEPLPPLPNHKQYMPSYKKELKVCEAKTVKSSVDEPPEVELKDIPLHLEYTFLEGDNKLPIIIAKELGDEEKSALIKLLKSHKRAIA